MMTDADTISSKVRSCYERLVASRKALLSAKFGDWFDAHAALCEVEEEFVASLTEATGLTRQELGAIGDTL